MRHVRSPIITRLGLVLLAASALGACTSAGGGGGVGTTLGNYLLYGGATVPPAAPVPSIEIADCPAVTVTDGGAAIRSGGGEGAQTRSQLSISEVARECVGREDGAVLVKVGIQVRALIGPGGGSSRFDTPVYVAVTRGDQVLASRRSRISVAVPPGQFEKSEILVEDGFVVPPGTGEFDIQVGLGSGPKPAAAERPARRRAARG